MDHEFQFDKNRKRAELCPCGKSNRDGKFSPYIGFTDKGYCHGCGQNFFPVKEKENNSFSFVERIKTKPTQEKPISFIDFNVFQKSLDRYESNNFISFLKTAFKSSLVEEAITKYKIGTSKHWNGATVFWQIDPLGNVRTGKIMLYDKLRGKRVKEPHSYINWVHAVLKLTDFNYKQVLFGSHLIKSSTNTVAIVESEKTAIIASICFPQYLWLATSGKSGLNKSKFNDLKNRKIILFPDSEVFETWHLFTQNCKNEFNIKVSNLLINIPENDPIYKGADIADFLLKSIPLNLKPSTNLQNIIETPSNVDALSKFKSYNGSNPALDSLISKLALDIDLAPSSNDNWQNDIPGTIKKIGVNILPDTAYHIDEIKTLIKTHHSAINMDFNSIIHQLITNQVLVQNMLNKEYYYKYDSTPF
jgi:Domain of unknown function (DUF6371)